MGRVLKKKTPIVPNEPITAKAVHELLRNGVLSAKALKNSALPKVDDPAIRLLAKFAEGLRMRVVGFTGPWRMEKKRLTSVSEAVSLLAKELPIIQEEYRARVKTKTAERWKPEFESWRKQYLKETKEDLAVMDALNAATSYFRERGFSYNDIRIRLAEVTGKKTEKWKHFAKDLIAEFHSALPTESKKAGYRFIAALTPLISGEKPSEEAVKTHFLHKRAEPLEAPPDPDASLIRSVLPSPQSERRQYRPR